MNETKATVTEETKKVSKFSGHCRLIGRHAATGIVKGTGLVLCGILVGFGVAVGKSLSGK